MQTHEIRKRFLDHFVKAGHTEVPSASVILDDPNLLFVNAGMVQFVPYFLGQRTPPWDRATSVQKCIRTPDIDEVGITTRHNTFFQMAGNFSFGDYFKKGAIELAWSLLTNPVSEGGYGFDPERLWATVYLDDDEAIELWQEVAGLPAERIQRRGMADNYWSMGIPGPCGPCSEIYYDRGPDYGIDGGPEANEDRYIEIWNLVFMQNERGEGTSKDDFEILGPLPRKNIDTGMGVERIACLLQGVDNVYETDLVRPVIDLVAGIAPRGYGQGNHTDDVRYRIIGDHSRTAAIIIGDGVTPGNEGRGYVLRRLLRRIIRAAKLLGVEQPIMGELMATVRDEMGPSYPELVTDFERINRIAIAEETAFNRTLTAGSRLFEDAAETTRKAGSTVLSGDDAFTLHDTFGFPIDLTLEMAAEAGLSVDEEGFRGLMAEQRRRAKADAAARKQAHTDLSAYRELVDAGPTEFTGFDELTTEARILGIFVDGRRVPVVSHVQGGDAPGRVELILNRSPFYAESGGQIADEGTVTGTGASQTAKAAVTDVQKIAKTLWAHRITVESGEFVEGDTIVAAVDPRWRHGATQGHSGTHMVHAALRQVLGPNAVQAGSLNRPGYLRFDFNWQGALSDDQRSQIEEVTNEAVEADYEVHNFTTELEKAKSMGAMALFGENYPDEVRVVEIGGPFSIELCGGTHVRSSAQIGPVTILGESSVGSGVRRVEAYVGLDSFRHLAKERALMAGLASSLKVPSDEVPARVENLVERLRAAEKELDRLRLVNARAAAANAAAGAEQIGGIRLVAQRMAGGISAGDLRSLVGDIRGKLGSDPAVVALISEADDDTVPFVVAVNQAAQDRGLRANDLVKVLGAAVNGRGGGKADLAQGSGKGAAGIDAALAAIRAEMGRS
ncbi:MULTISPECIES: alanine--tRNA ligase [Mycolicibacterium]|uniref:Alanine--tRNA ligase n=3 Tax=Mycolicibacterium gilvum TaxID=1804 RepID=SYA_MYCGI|nr:MULTISPECIES: alanine--tRNA ligase [Mycolicibacterium]A4TBW4.1 RecName: Full=Alanine--tRNA ligase; AltName: Full=Alanyl-tRNA synthetase; Short=AlaRS [Mycolicibacterium gilvum PYR-GCK]ABP46235.1 alanyl-tRNA synthetase [Mycolicibacterium gilvum PYR-GCK]ADT99721.1 alanyl-tRNA synthetase [Mycolicibacterium gilvum Spyr1]MBV5244031.1 alanine--tRNA ligase [Mycolicibacterium sp. PAM1]MCV7055358.1 alanine--tRNA ligase [Mycolicibacterium gilvum]STZ43338.1 alanyl-tRNA synthetase [Mycolicibacterium gi